MKSLTFLALTLTEIAHQFKPLLSPRHVSSAVLVLSTYTLVRSGGQSGPDPRELALFQRSEALMVVMDVGMLRRAGCQGGSLCQSCWLSHALLCNKAA